MPTSHGGHIFISKIVYFQHKSAKKIDFRWKFKYNYSVLLFLSKSKLLKCFRQDCRHTVKEVMNIALRRHRTRLSQKKRNEASKIGRLWKCRISEVDAWMKSGVAAEK